MVCYMFLRELLPPTPPLLAPPKKQQYNQHASCGTPRSFLKVVLIQKIAFGFPFFEWNVQNTEDHRAFHGRCQTLWKNQYASSVFRYLHHKHAPFNLNIDTLAISGFE